MSLAPLTRSPRALAHRAAQVAVDLGLVTAAYWLSFYFRFDGDVPGRYERLFVGTIGIVIGVKLVVFVAMRFYTKWWRFTSCAASRKRSACSALPTSKETTMP